MSDVPPPAPRGDTTWPVIAHLSAIAGYVIPFGTILGPLTVWLMRRDTDPETEYHAREALNFQISMTIWWVISFLLIFVVIGIPMLIFFMFATLVLMIVAAVKASSGQRYRYPFTWRFVGPPVSPVDDGGYEQDERA